MAKSLGSNAGIALSVNGVTYSAIGKIKSITLPPSVNMVDATDNDSGGYKEKLPGDTEFKLSVTANYDNSDVGQIAILDTLDQKTPMYFRYRPKGTSTGEIQYVGSGYASKVSIDSKHESIQELSFDVEFSGPVTRSVQ